MGEPTEEVTIEGPGSLFPATILVKLKYPREWYPRCETCAKEGRKDVLDMDVIWWTETDGYVGVTSGCPRCVNRLARELCHRGIISYEIHAREDLTEEERASIL